MLWEMLAYSLHYSAKRRTDRDPEGGNELDSGSPLHSLVSPWEGRLFLQPKDYLGSLSASSLTSLTKGSEDDLWKAQGFLFEFCYTFALPDKRVVGI